MRPLKEADPKIRVRFWFTNDDATLPLDKIEKFEAREPIDPKKIKSKVVAKQYVNALAIAKGIVDAGKAEGGDLLEEQEWSEDEEAYAEKADEETEEVRDRRG